MSFGDFLKGVVGSAAPIVGGFLGGPAGAALGGAVSSGIDASMQASATKEDREWQEYMSNTAHQREVKDLRAAGLNPILSGMGGKGASPGASNPQNVPDMLKSLTALQASEQIKLTQAQVDQATAQTSKIREEREGLNIANTDAQNQLDADWGTGSKKTGWKHSQQQAAQEEAVTRILEARQRTDSAKETMRKERILNDAMQGNRKLQQFILSASYAEQETINRALSETSSPADFWQLMQKLLPYVFK